MGVSERFLHLCLLVDFVDIFSNTFWTWAITLIQQTMIYFLIMTWSLPQGRRATPAWYMVQKKRQLSAAALWLCVSTKLHYICKWRLNLVYEWNKLGKCDHYHGYHRNTKYIQPHWVKEWFSFNESNTIATYCHIQKQKN